MTKSITKTKMMTRRVVMSDSFRPTRVSAFTLDCCPGALTSPIVRCFDAATASSSASSSSLMRSSSSRRNASSSPPSVSLPPGGVGSMLHRLAKDSVPLCSSAVLYVLYSLTSRSSRMMRTVRAARAPARPARLVFSAPPLLSVSVSSVSISAPPHASSFQTHVRSKNNVTVAPTSRRKKKPRKYSSFPRDAATTSIENTRMQNIVRKLKKLSMAWCVAANLKSSPKSAYNVSTVVSTQKRQLSHNRLLLMRNQLAQ
mmetsp:Transcript_79069/g.241884  ORF Transcript_79069/g.241884 Transcript_79069/m.241884 type:complete len:257 (-) Transcript_79069:320-1090(-)